MSVIGRVQKDYATGKADMRRHSPEWLMCCNEALALDESNADETTRKMLLPTYV